MESKWDQQPFVWHSEVRSYELDAQGIVNNAHYMHYFDEARIQFLYSKGVDWVECHNAGFDIVLVHAEISFKSSLKSQDAFRVVSEVEEMGRIKILCRQSIYREKDNELVATAVNTLVWVSSKTGKPVRNDHANIFETKFSK